MKLNTIKYWAIAFTLGLGISSCGDFLDRPTEDNYNTDNFYQNAEQCFQAVNPIYNSPWYDFQRGFFKVGEVLSGNYYWGASPYLTFTVNSTDEDLVNMAASLWSVNAYCNGVIENINMKAGNVSTDVKNTCKGECLVWKAMTYFYLVRTFGAVPIIHDNSSMISAGNYNDVYRAKVENVYDYIIMTLNQAIKWLPERNKDGRIDRYSAEGLLAKVYLTKSGYGMHGSRNESDLAEAARLAKDVIDHSGRSLEAVYSDVFRIENNYTREALISWHWVVSNTWTSQNTLQSDLGIAGIDGFGAAWGGYGGPSVDLQDAFGEDAIKLARNNKDDRRKATMMMAGDSYNYFWKDKGGLDYLNLFYAKGNSTGGEYQSATGANEVKHIVGDEADHKDPLGTSMARMATSLSTHILRLSDIYLVYAEAVIGNSGSTTDATAIDAFYKVRHRSRSTYDKPASITWEDVWKERRLELACEGDRWYDYVRWHYYEPAKAIAELKAQRRASYSGLNDYYKAAWNNGSYNENATYKPGSVSYDANAKIPNVTDASFTLPFPDTDKTMNHHLADDEPIDVDITQYSYK